MKVMLGKEPRRGSWEGWLFSSDHMSLCSDVLESEIRRILHTPTAMTKRASFRCSGWQ